MANLQRGKASAMILPFMMTLTLKSDKVTEIAADADSGLVPLGDTGPKRPTALKGALAMAAVAAAAVAARMLLQRKAR